MDLIEELRSAEEKEKRPSKKAVSAYLSKSQREGLTLLTQKSSMSQSKVIGRLIDLAVARLQSKNDALRKKAMVYVKT